MAEFKFNLESTLTTVNLVRELYHDLLEHGLKPVTTETDPWKLVLFVRNLRLFHDLMQQVLAEDYQPTAGPEELYARLVQDRQAKTPGQ